MMMKYCPGCRFVAVTVSGFTNDVLAHATSVDASSQASRMASVVSNVVPGFAVEAVTVAIDGTVSTYTSSGPEPEKLVSQPTVIKLAPDVLPVTLPLEGKLMTIRPGTHSSISAPSAVSSQPGSPG